MSYLESLFSLSGKVAVVIGGTGELCGAMAEGLAGAGAEVVLAGRDATKAKARIARIEASSPSTTLGASPAPRAWFQPVESTSRQSLEELRDAVIARSGRIDIVINGA